nr:MAG TPA: hypothetical protein [Caudoviricetes sp.]
MGLETQLVITVCRKLIEKLRREIIEKRFYQESEIC